MQIFILIYRNKSDSQFFVVAAAESTLFLEKSRSKRPNQTEIDIHLIQTSLV